MGDKNKKIRNELQEIYGQGCMFKKAKIAERIEKMGGIRTYTTFVAGKKYTRKKIKAIEMLETLHHLKHRAEGGETTIENGAVVNALAHEYLHSLPREQEEVINNMLREYKECKVVYVDHLDLGVDIKFTTFRVPDRKKEKYDRAKMKRETKELEDAYYRGKGINGR